MMIPKEHGAWFMLYGPFFAGIAAAKSFDWSVGLLLIAATAFFMAHSPILTLVRLNRSQPARRTMVRKAYKVMCICLALGISVTLIVVVHEKLFLLIPLGAIAILFEALHTYMVYKKLDRSLLARCAAICSLTTLGPATYYVLTRRLDDTAFLLWLLCTLYFVSSVFYVKMRVDSFAGKKTAAHRKWLCGIYHALLAFGLALFAALEWIPLLLAAGFFPVILRAFWAILRVQKTLNLKRIGFAEVAYTTVFIVFLSIGV